MPANPDAGNATGPTWNAETYDAPRRRLVPDFDLFYGTAAELIDAVARPGLPVLDLGAGTGLLSDAIRQRHPEARFSLFDAEPTMLEVARSRLGEATTAIIVGDLAGPLPAGPFGAVVSALAIHHLDDDGKRDLFARILAVLEPGGVFVHAEQVAGPTEAAERRYAELHERDARALGATDAEWSAALGRMRLDRAAPLDAQLAWLRDAGFEEVDVAFRRYRFAVYAGRAPLAG